MSADAQLVVLGWALGVVVAALAGLFRWVWSLWKSRLMNRVIDFFYSGTNLRNRGGRIQRADTAGEEAWMREWEEWKVDMEEAARSYSRRKAANVSNLVNVPPNPIPYPGLSGPMVHSVSELSETLLRLSVFIAQ